MSRCNAARLVFIASAMTFVAPGEQNRVYIIIIYSLEIGAGQQGRISGTYNCIQYKIQCRNIKYKRIAENTFTITT